MDSMSMFTGAWRLVAVEDSQPGGAVAYPYGPRPAGLLIYDPSGRMAVQIMRRDRPPLSSRDWAEVSSEEVKSAVSGFTAFFGRYQIDAQSQTIIHHVEGHILPDSVGKSLARSFEFSGDELILKPSQTRRVIWERVR